MKQEDKEVVVSETYNWESRHILIVEDDDSSSFLLGEILKRTGAELSYAFNGIDAINYIRKNPTTDLVLMDIQLPDKDGLTATREIKAINKNIPVITQSSYINLALQDNDDPNGADDFLPKPINPRVLLSKIKFYLG